MEKNKKERTKERIVSAAIVLFRENGFDSTTVKEITEAAQVAKGTFFNYFPTKESILQSLIEERLVAVSQLMSRSSFKKHSLFFKIEKVLGELLADYNNHPELTVKMWVHSLQSEQTILTYWENLLTQAVTLNEIKPTVCVKKWSHLLNSQFLYGLVMFSDRQPKNKLIKQIMDLISICLQAILEKRGNHHMHKLVILGGGYGGMRILQRLLTNDLPKNIEVTLIDKMPYHCLKTEYYALAAGTESDHHIRVQFPDDPRLIIKYANVEEIDLDNKVIHFKDEDSYAYDTLIIGLGCEDKYHNVPGAPEHTLSIQSMESTRKTYQTISNLSANAVVSIVGAGLSGVEVASELRESRPDLTIKLFDRGEIVLSMFPRRLSTYVQNWFVDHGIEVYNKSNITGVEKNTLFNHGEPIHCDAIIWTAGIQPVEVVRNLDIEKDEQGRVKLTPHHHLLNDEDVFVVGDCASLPHAPSAQLAEGQGEQIVTILKKRWNGEELPETMPKIKLKGVLGSLGKKHGFGLMGERTLLGRVPRVLKSGVLWMYKYHSG
ncbi:FAD-dependent oxidoreductase [Alkalihalobacillus sp. BA299]|uniref:FAD-dependent oxidoreductase n=1 Tax=Alkalihalobacillus sp. BA299 TaxID=2815938 RepID=UPI001ADD4375|nr:FAD-dependent oxidoreductase [Alkalihalobacillus sp. BA299]